MTQDELTALIRDVEKSRIGRVLRSRMVVHSTHSNSSFKAYYGGEVWIAETWDPIAFAFPLTESNVLPVVHGLLSVPLHSQFDYVQEQFPNAARLTSCSVRGIGTGLDEAGFTSQIIDAAKFEGVVSVSEFSGGFRILAGGAFMVLLFIGNPSLPVQEDEVLIYCSDETLMNRDIQRFLVNAGLNVVNDQISI